MSSGPHLYYEETIARERKYRYCLKIISCNEGNKDRRYDSIYIEANNKEGEQPYFSILEEKKIQDHIDTLVSGLERSHKNVMWNMCVGTAAVTRYTGTSVHCRTLLDDERNVEDILGEKFSIRNPLTWSKSLMTDVETALVHREFKVDGVIAILATGEVDTQNMMAGITEAAMKSVTKYCNLRYGSRYCKEAGNKSTSKYDCRKSEIVGRVIYIGYQWLTSVTTAEILTQALMDSVDMVTKRRQVLRYLQELGLSPYHEERLRRVLLTLHPVLSNNQIEIFQSLVQLTSPIYPKLKSCSSNTSKTLPNRKLSNTSCNITNSETEEREDQRMINITVLKCGQEKLRDFSVSRRECQCYKIDK